MSEAKSKAALRTELEQSRGRQIAGRAKRESDLQRYIQGGKIRVMVALPGHEHYEDKGRVNLFYLNDGDADGTQPLLAHQNMMADDYPSEVVVATIAMVVGATIGTEGIPAAETIDPEVRARRNQYRDRHLGLWRDK